MAAEKKTHRKPAIIVTHSDHERLSRLAEAHAARNPEVSEELLAELDRARIVPDNKIGIDVVRMGSTLQFVSDLGDERLVMLVFPGEADIAAGKVSILTPIGAALIGLSTSQSIDWTARDGRVHRLTVKSVEAPVVSFPASRGLVELRSAL
ncbi:nucleoside diphosphate kinase regulator [Aliirhizobium cellulosilyticum]|uniref:Regulator of nucleoside diphosphate kinase n=1 Tax=Aliirhizobium cellulosilyticum TaxID=393664 RepID=A0A7W6TK33_9HYPH|nr:nucleoside diphosphate kinase regulator [Rhizobium cellulosilyticum]MBB4351574.1 regulator of nucleoside diphosphate kinase [Rhizobium cellulosilyticum]MBB4414826.1 regulator of nucleoside diphosphate kinase [Rhizobium cellulosilyticum]MBB4449500.1 regulator of nucleoside diphosphate kinase [Rhizobium cellulosilyticum]